MELINKIELLHSLITEHPLLSGSVCKRHLCCMSTIITKVHDCTLCIALHIAFDRIHTATVGTVPIISVVYSFKMAVCFGKIKSKVNSR